MRKGRLFSMPQPAKGKVLLDLLGFLAVSSSENELCLMGTDGRWTKGGQDITLIVCFPYGVSRRIVAAPHPSDLRIL